jgi:phospholipid/cholesterol/gamma-HCH transport system substrate-binding protein
MIFGKTKLELKVGIFVFIGLIILVVFVLLIGNFQTWTSGYHLNFIFNFVNGVKLGAPVRFAGVDVGEVQQIRFILTPPDRKPKVQILCWLNNDVKVPVDSTIWVNTLGLLGEKYIEIMPGQSYKDLLSENQSLKGEDPIPMHEVAVLARSIAADIDENLVRIKNKEGTVGKLLYDDTVYKELEAFMIDIRKHPWKLFIKGKEKP